MRKLIVAENMRPALERPESLVRRGSIEVYPARTSEEILDLHRTHKADLIIADLELPVMGGAKLCAAIRGDGALKDVSIIMACDGSETAAAQSRGGGANAVIAKPIDPVALFQMVSELIVVPERKDMRVLLRVNIIGDDRGTPFFASSENISISGMLIETAARISMDERLLCSFYIGHSEMKTEAKVTRPTRYWPRVLSSVAADYTIHPSQ